MSLSKCPFPAFVLGMASAAALYGFVRYFRDTKNPCLDIPQCLLKSQHRKELEVAVDLAYEGDNLICL